MKLVFIALVMMVSATSFAAESEDSQSSQEQNQGQEQGRPLRRHRGPKLTDEQRTCLEGQIGKPGEGVRPTHEQMDAAFTSCGIEKPPAPPQR